MKIEIIDENSFSSLEDLNQDIPQRLSMAVQVRHP